MEDVGLASFLKITVTLASVGMWSVWPGLSEEQMALRQLPGTPFSSTHTPGALIGVGLNG